MSNEGDTSTQRQAKEPKLDCYAILGVHPNAEDVVIRAAFKALAQRYHPDRFSGSKDEAHRRMSDLTHAYEILCDPVRRGKYDRRRRLKAVSATYQLKDASRESAPDPTVESPVTTAARQRRYRQAVVALVGAVVVLSAFNLYQYSGRLKSWIASSPSATTPGATSRGAAETPIPIVTNTSADPPVELPVARPKSPPLAPGAIDPAAVVPAGRTPPRTASVEPARSPAAPAPAPAPRRDPPVASANPPVAPANPPVASASPPLASASPPLAPAKAPAAKGAAAAVESLGVARGGTCTDAVIALGLCKTDTTAAKTP